MSYSDWSLSPKKMLQAFPKLPSPAAHTLPIAVFILGFLGFLDATYLTVLHYKNVTPPCSVAHGCEAVLTSQYATLLGIPIAFIGALFYVTALMLLLLWMQTKKTIFTTLLVSLTGAGFVIAVLLVGIQAFILHAFCQYCLASELIDFLLFDCAWWLWRRNG